MTTKAERIEAVEKALIEAGLYRTLVTAEELAQAAMAADHVAEDVKRLVLVLMDVAQHTAEPFKGELLMSYVNKLVEDELKKWSGE